MRSKILILLLTLGIFGCEDFLEEKSQSEVRPSTVKDMEKILEAEAYFGSKEGTIFNRATDIFTDDIACNVVTDQLMTIQKMRERYRFEWNRTMFDEGGGGMDVSFWDLPYQRIKGCNVVLDYVEGMDGDPVKREHIRGEAHALRGFYYMMLVNLFGMPYNYGDATKNPGVPLKLSSGVSSERFRRNSVAECYAQIEKDLLRGAELMEANAGKQSIKLTRMNYLAAYALLSRMYLYMEDWDNALKYADLVLQTKSDLLELRVNSTGGVYFSTTPDEILWTGLEEEVRYVTGIRAPYTVSNELSGVYSRDADGVIDIRGDYYRVNQEVTLAPVYLKRGREWANGAYQYWAALVLKSDGLNISGSLSRYNGGIRTAEMYLNRAEVYIRKYMVSGSQEEAKRALKDLNALRESRFDEGYVEKEIADFTSGKELLDFCLRERRRELCGEGNHRWFDLRRLGMPQIIHVFLDNDNGNETRVTLQEKDSRYALPIPEEVIRKNPNLSQN